MTDPTPKERPYGGRTRAERDAERRRRLLDAGLDAFGTAGYPATSVEAICTAAGVSSRNYYEYYDGREGLLIAIYDEIVDGALAAVLAALAPLPDSATVRERSAAGLTAFAEAMLGDPRRARVNFIEVVGASREVEAHRRNALRRFAAMLLELGEYLMAEGLITPRPPVHLAVGCTAIIGAVQETLTDWMSRDDRPPLGEVLDGLVEIVVLMTVRPAS